MARVPVTDAEIHIWTPMTPGKPCIAMVDGLPAICKAATPLKAKSKMRAFLAEESLRLERSEAGKAARARALAAKQETA